MHLHKEVKSHKTHHTHETPPQQTLVSIEEPKEPKGVSFEQSIKSMPFLKEVAEAEHFVLSTGRRIKSLLELQHELMTMSEDVFKSHVTEWKNDFASWVYHSIGDKTLAETLGALKTQAANIRAVKERVREHAYKKMAIRKI